jgi:hypothetical protein
MRPGLELQELPGEFGKNILETFGPETLLKIKGCPRAPPA